MLETIILFGCLWASYKVVNWAEANKKNNKL